MPSSSVPCWNTVDVNFICNLFWRSQTSRLTTADICLTSHPYIVGWRPTSTNTFKARSHWWNSDETVMKQVESAWNRMNQSDETVMKYVESGWISNETICFMVVKHRETCWIRMNQQWNNLFHGREPPSNMLNQDETWSWNTLNQDETMCFMVMKHCFMPMKHLESGTVTTEIYIFLYWFLVHGVSLRFFMLFYCCFMLFHCCFIAVSCCFNAVSLLFHTVSLLFNCCFMLFHCCFMLFHCCFTVFHRSVSWCFKAFRCPV